MGFLDKINQKAAGFEEDYAYEDEDFVSQETEEETAEAPTSIRSVSQSISRIVTVWVYSYRDIKDFAVDFRSGMPVILNLSEASDNERARIVDFAVGLCFGLEGDFSRISDDVFLLTPYAIKLESHGDLHTQDFHS